MLQRELKFQFWIESEKRMIGAVGFCFESDTQIRIWYRQKAKHADDDDILVNESFACHDVKQREFIGLYDKNNNPIFEGDVVKTSVSVGDVQFSHGVFGVEWTRCKINKSMVGGWGQLHNLKTLDDSIIEDIEVIGNIYQTTDF